MDGRQQNISNFQGYIFIYETFSVYLPVLMMDTINGRNDLEIVGLTPDEIERLIGTLFKKVGL